jgi:hypothetical protein
MVCQAFIWADACVDRRPVPQLSPLPGQHCSTGKRPRCCIRARSAQNCDQFVSDCVDTLRKSNCLCNS